MPLSKEPKGAHQSVESVGDYMSVCHICKEREATPRRASSPMLCVECMAEGAQLIQEDRHPKPAKPFRISDSEESGIRQQAADWMAWHKQQCFLPEPPICDHNARDGAGNNWSTWAGLICGKRSVCRSESGQHYCADHRPAPRIELTDLERQQIINDHTVRMSASVARISKEIADRKEQLRACHLYYSPELGDELKRGAA